MPVFNHHRAGLIPWRVCCLVSLLCLGHVLWLWGGRNLQAGLSSWRGEIVTVIGPTAQHIGVYLTEWLEGLTAQTPPDNHEEPEEHHTPDL